MTQSFPYRFLQNHPATAWASLLLLGMLALRLLTGFNGLYGQDSYAYLMQSQAWGESFRGGPQPPAFFWPEGYPFLGAVLGTFMPLAGALQLISMLSAVLTLYCCIRLGKELFPDVRHHGPILFVLVGLSPWGLRSGMLVMSDSLGVALLTLAGWWAWRYLRDGKWTTLLGVGLALGWAVSVRYPLALPGLLPVAMVGWGAWKRRDARILLFPLALLGVVVGHFALHEGMTGGLTGHHFLGEWSIGNWFQRDFSMRDGEFHYPVINLVYALGGFWHPGLVGLGVIALPLGIVRKVFGRDRRTQLLALASIVYLLFLAGIPFQNPRFLLPVLPMVGLIYLAVLGKVANKMTGKWVLLSGIVAVLIHLALIGYTSRKVFLANRLEQKVANWPPTEEGKTVYTFGMDGALKVYRPEMRVINLWDEPLKTVEPGAWLLFNEEAFQEQWDGKNPMLNFEYLRKNYELQELKKYEEGWTWYEIK